MTPDLTVSKWGEVKIAPAKKSIAENLFKIKHWVIEQGEYYDIPNQKATWFIDPPYQDKGYKYRHNSSKIDFDHLGEWSRSREGQVIVCESANATWLPFEPMVKQHGIRHDTMEGIWTNEPNIFNKQIKMIL